MTTESASVSGLGPPPALSAPVVPAGGQAPSAIPAQGPQTTPPRGLLPGRPRRGALAVALLGIDLLAVTATGLLILGPEPATALVLVPALLVLAGLQATGGQYGPSPLTRLLGELPRLAAHSAVAWCVGCALTAAVRPAPAALALLALVAVQTLASATAREAVRGLRRRAMRRQPRSSLVIASGEPGLRIISVLQQHPEYGLRPVGMVVPNQRSAPVDCPLPVLSAPQEVARAIIQNTVRDALVLREPGEREDPALMRLCWEQGCTVWLVDLAPGPGNDPERRGTGADHLWGFACWRLDPPRTPATGHAAKRLMDMVLASVALLLAAPLLLACALAVRLADGPGVLFRQQRIGQGGKPFVMLKFRTLRPDDDSESATRWNIAGDARMSPVGRILRRTSLDELPQLWNVLRGDMSMVGPRPERPHFVAEFSRTHPGYAQRHRMPVGLTGLAQISGLRGDTSIEDRARFDNHYIDTWSLWQDLCIMLRTSVSCFRCGGS